jgi:GNAT superfamily N-acetyltransferase
LITHFLGGEEVAGYARDLAQRLVGLGDLFPTVWCPIGKSGDKLLRVLAKELSRLAPDRAASIRVVEFFYNKDEGTASIGKGATSSDLKDAVVLVLDSSVHSGRSMLSVVRAAEQYDASRVFSYSLIVKRSSNFVPHYFGVVVGDHDRVLFQLDNIPNNRLFSGKDLPICVFRRIDSHDAARTSATLDTGVKSLDKISFGDLYYEHRVNGFDVVLAEDQGRIAGFLKIRASEQGALLIDVIANDKAYRGKGVGGALMRYAETMGRAGCCTHIELWAIENQVSFYEKFGFDKTNEVIDTGGGERYRLMRKRLLYHFDLNDLL